jgi:hypothetical protein
MTISIDRAAGVCTYIVSGPLHATGNLAVELSGGADRVRGLEVQFVTIRTTISTFQILQGTNIYSLPKAMGIEQHNTLCTREEF